MTHVQRDQTLYLSKHLDVRMWHCSCHNAKPPLGTKEQQGLIIGIHGDVMCQGVFLFMKREAYIRPLLFNILFLIQIFVKFNEGGRHKLQTQE